MYGIFDPTLSNEKLAAMVVSEYPEDAELAGSPLEKWLILGRDGQKRDPARYAAIFQLALGMTESQERIAAFSLEQVNGLRRRDGLWETDPVCFALGGIMAVINNLSPDHPRLKRLLGLANYNGGILYRNLGQFEKAAQYQRSATAMELAAGHSDKAAISLFCCQVELTSAAFMTGDAISIREAVATLYQMGRCLEPVMDKDWMDNVAIHIIEFHFLSQTMPPDLSWLLGLLDPKKTNFWPEIIHQLYVPCLRGEWMAILANANVLLDKWAAEPSSSTQKAIYGCFLAKARALRKEGNHNGASGCVLTMNHHHRHHHGGYDYLVTANREFGLSPD
ncbi:hypothetical protein HZB05_01905 [Candidatus Wolfebacteria bacterium]|nr:hypothetical protein [Candidatus Wolfebacteria bacterium]